MQTKDLNIIMETAREYGIPLPSAAVDLQLYTAMLQAGLGDMDNSAILNVIEGLANEVLKTE
jgi:2-hydroxy-3-oxopropionate reductase